MTFSVIERSLILHSLLGDIVDISCYVLRHFYITNCRKISRKIPQEISQLTTLVVYVCDLKKCKYVCKH